MKKIFFYVLLIGYFTGCVSEDHVLEIEILNSSSENVSNIRVSTAGDKITFEADELAPGKDIAHTLKVPNNKVDGKYTLVFTRGNGQKETSTGRYLKEEEGYLKKTLSFTILENSVNVQQKELEVK